MEPRKQLSIIDEMVRAANQSYQKSAFYFLLWGGLLSLAAFFEYFTSLAGNNHWQIWPLIGGVGGIVTVLYARWQTRRAGVVTKTGRLIWFLWGAFGVVLILVVLFCIKNRIHPHGLILAIAGMATFVSGGMAKFKPFLLGGLVLWIGSLLLIYGFAGAEKSLVYGFCIFMAYFVPGLILFKKEKNEIR